MAPIVPWKRAIRYIATDGSTRYGEPQIQNDHDDILELAQKGELEVHILEGDSILKAVPTGKRDRVKELLSPMTVSEVSFIRCIGLNYRTHSRELDLAFSRT